MKLRKIGTLVIAALAITMAGALYVTSLGDPGTSVDNPRFRSSAVFLSLSASKEQVERYLKERGSLEGVAHSISIQPSTYASRIYVSDTGLMTAVDAKNEFVLMLEPLVKGRSVEWKCSVMPTSAAPKPCRAK
ncbi:MAG: hypothetical protein EOO15_21810 [Chitinophagaceae bacterium]|nr:MAG: hypothetical protein EOO15_21810 [Chitinophagaceae bacterium]